MALVKKKSGDIRMCLGLKKHIFKDNFPLPLIEDCLEYLKGICCSSVIDFIK